MRAADRRAASPPRELERLRYWQGQLLRGRDFRDQLAIEAELRAWHNRALHATGVSGGLSVQGLPGRTPETVRVDAGLAYDCYGRELALARPREVEVPAEPPRAGGDWILVLRLPGGPAAHGRPLAEPELAWEPADSLRPSRGVPLVRAKRVSGRLVLDIGTDRRPSRALARPRFATGATTPRATPWQLWTLPSDDFAGLQVRVDTSAAGFTGIPCYFAWLEAVDWSGSGGTAPDRLVELIVSPHVAEETARQLRSPCPSPSSPVSFCFRFAARPGKDLPGYAARAGLHVCWAGIEHGPVSPLFVPSRERCCP
jgi:hypothetical protein